MEQQAPPQARKRPVDPDEVMKVAFELQDEARKVAEREEKVVGLARAGRELGLDPEYVTRAEDVVRAREEAKEARAAEATKQRRKMGLMGLGVLGAGSAVLVGAVGLAALVSWMTPDPVQPWSDAFGTGAATWRLETSPGSAAEIAWVEDAAHGTVAEVTVDRFGTDGKHFVNLESEAHPDWTGVSEVSFATRGEGLKNVRLYLESDTERWRGPVVPVGSAWSTHTLDLRSFEHQVRTGSDWKVVGWKAPTDVDTTSFKLGWFVNDAADAGTVWIDDLSAR